jgi:hypothetical protein
VIISAHLEKMEDKKYQITVASTDNPKQYEAPSLV